MENLEQTEKAAAANVEVDQHVHEDSAEQNFRPKSLKFWLIIVGVYLAIFLVMLDRLIIATAIPQITNDFHSIEDIGWYGSAYMLTAAIFHPLFGRIYQSYPTKWVFLISIIVFEVGSAICGAAPDSDTLIVGRAFAGIGAAGVFTGGIMVIVPLVPLRRRPVFTSFFGIAAGVSSVLGPLVGGTFTDNPTLTWRWCFYINLPIGAFTFAVVLLFFNLDPTKRDDLSIGKQILRLDPLGLLFFVPAIVCLILALQWGGTTYAWSAPVIIGLFVTFAVLLVAFLIVEVLMPDTAMAPMRVVLNRSVGGGMIFMLVTSGGMMAVFYYVAIWFQAAQGQSAMEAGIRTISMVLSLVVLGIVGAIFVEKVGYYNPLLLISPILCAAGAGMLSTLTPGAGSNHWIGYQVLYGTGIGFGFQTAMLVPQAILPSADVPLGMALMFFMQQMGGSMFLSAGQNIFSNALVDMLAGVGGLDVKAIVNTGATALRKTVPPDELEPVIRAYSYALTRVFILAAALGACAILGAAIIEWKSIKGIKGRKGGRSQKVDVDAEDGKSNISS